MYIIIAIIVFGILIAVHELGHFAAAKAFGVKVLEFSIGMGPRLLKKQGKETLYSLRAFPFGGSCLMEGEDEETPDPRSFTAQRRWKRVIILVAGAFMNFVFGAVVVFILVSQMGGFTGTTVTQLADGFPTSLQGQNGLMVGDKLMSVNGERLYYVNDFSVFMELASGKPVDLTVQRDGKEVTLTDFPLQKREYTDDGVKTMRYGISFNGIQPTAGEKIKYATYTTLNYVRLVRVSLTMLFTGAVGLNQVSGPVGIVSVMNQAAEGQAFWAALANIASISALVAVNLAVMNLLPIPALDGGRIFFLIVTFFVEKISRRRVDPKYEGYIHTAGFFLLIGLMCVVLVSDVLKLVHG
ncbi:regulator of sigma E protease [Sporobacter termitidis DSM 10068]|uniref:Regulator of sigma E protease n=1 Tax=Sporobacter termitidis DSM 10068 TaxID=1123282 RepID=A0A1M5VKW3_9FIRM|nr:M50 family metallopeptidase [Sporobacter termitidis]SHH75865.1 regulator of sigma E protease [Sporobacter termitidis DSM 10068]